MQTEAEDWSPYDPSPRRRRSAVTWGKDWPRRVIEAAKDPLRSAYTASTAPVSVQVFTGTLPAVEGASGLLRAQGGCIHVSAPLACPDGAARLIVLGAEPIPTPAGLVPVPLLSPFTTTKDSTDV